MAQNVANTEIDSYVSKLKSAGMRVTEQRKAILRLLFASTKPVSVKDAHDSLNKKKKIVDLASLYRIFETFEDLEIIHQAGHNAYVLCQHMTCKSKYHVLLHCRSCGGFNEMHMPQEQIESFATFFKKSKKFEIDQHPLSLSGLCTNCR